MRLRSGTRWDSPPRSKTARKPANENPLHLACRLHHGEKILQIARESPHLFTEANGGDGKLALHSFFSTSGERFSDTNTVEELIKLSPGLLATQDKDGSTPLHLAISHRYPANIVAALIEAAPEALTVGGLENNALSTLGLRISHLACMDEDQYTFQIVSLIAKEFSAFLDDTAVGRNLVRFAVRVVWPWRALDVLKQSKAPGFSTTNRFGNMPLHELCAIDSAKYNSLRDFWYALAVCVRAYPKGLSHPNNDGDYPIHILFSRTPKIPFQNVKWILKSYPWVVEQRDARNWSIIHYIIASKSYSADVVLTLLDQNEQAFLTRVHWDLPILHWCCNVDCNPGIFGLLLDRYSHLALEHNAQTGDGLLDVTVRNGSIRSQCRTRILLDQAPVVVSTPNREERLPLHVLLEEDLQIDQHAAAQDCIFRKILDIYPEATKHKDSSGRTPLSFWKGKPKDQKARLLLEVDANSAGYGCSRGMLPLQYLVEQPLVSHESVMLLLEATRQLPLQTETAIQDAMVRSASRNLELNTICALVQACVGGCFTNQGSRAT